MTEARVAAEVESIVLARCEADADARVFAAEAACALAAQDLTVRAQEAVEALVSSRIATAVQEAEDRVRREVQAQLALDELVEEEALQRELAALSSGGSPAWDVGSEEVQEVATDPRSARGRSSEARSEAGRDPPMLASDLQGQLRGE